MAEQQQQQNQPQITPQDAKSFLSTFGHDPVKLDDTSATKLYSDIYPKYTKAVQDEVVKAKNGTDWRKEYVAGLKASVKDPATFDETKVLGRLERYQAPTAVVDALFQLQDRIGRGEMRSTLPKDAKPEDVTKWRAENGIPEKPEGYEFKLGDGVVLGDEDKAVVDQFRKIAHESNLQPAQFNAAVGFYYDLIEKQATEREENDTKARDATEDHFRKAWGGDYRKNKAIIDAYLDSGPPGLKDALWGARAADGTPLGSHVGFLTFLADRSREVIDAATFVPADAAAMGKSITDEINALKTLMADKQSEYWKGPKAEANQKRYRELVAANEKLASRPGAKK